VAGCHKWTVDERLLKVVEYITFTTGGNDDC